MTVQDFLLKIQHKINIVSRPMNSNIATPVFDKRSVKLCLTKDQSSSGR